MFEFDKFGVSTPKLLSNNHLSIMIFYKKNATSILTLLLCSMGLLTSCVSKKKSEAALSLQQSQFETKETAWRTEEKGLKKQIETLNLQLAENKGESKALWEVQRKLENRLLEKESEIDNISVRSVSQQVQLDSALSAKTKIIELREAELRSIRNTAKQLDTKVLSIKSEAQEALQAYEGDIEYENRDGNLHIILAETLLFKADSESTRIISRGEYVLEALSRVLENYPSIKAMVVGHTDNQQAKRYKSNWDYSLMRASAVGKMLTDEIGFSPNQVLIAGKSEFEPRASNATPTGRSLNRRVEIIIMPQINRLYQIARP